MKPGRSRTSSAFATASSASAGSRSAASETHQTPSGTSSATSAAACSASRVFPVPPGPVSVSNRTSSRRSRPTTSSSSRSRPRNGVAGTGRFVWYSVFRRGKSRVAELEQALRRREVLQTVLAEVANGLAGDEVARRLRQEHLPAVPGGGDPRRAVDVDPDVALVGHDRLARVEPHADADRPVAERRLPVGGGGDRVGGARERDEERVALRVHLDAAVPRESLAQHTAVLAQQLRVALAVLVQQPRRALDVREQERHRPRRQVPWHARSIVDDFPLDVSSPSRARRRLRRARTRARDSRVRARGMQLGSGAAVLVAGEADLGKTRLESALGGRARDVGSGFSSGARSISLARSCRTSRRGTPAPRAALAGRGSDDRLATARLRRDDHRAASARTRRARGRARGGSRRVLAVLLYLRS